MLPLPGRVQVDRHGPGQAWLGTDHMPASMTEPFLVLTVDTAFELYEQIFILQLNGLNTNFATDIGA